MKQKSLILMVVILMFDIGCVPPPITGDFQSIEQESVEAAVDSARIEKCEMYLSMGYEYYKQKNYQRARDKYLKVIGNGCGEEFYQKYVENLFYNIGSCYQNLNDLDTALYYYQQGLSISPENLTLLKNIAFIYSRQGDTENQLSTLMHIAKVEPENVENLWKILDILKKEEDFEQVLVYLKKIQDLTPDDIRIQTEMEMAYNATGRDPIDVICAQWETNRQDIFLGKKYADLLDSRGNIDAALVVYEELLQYDPKNNGVLEKLGKIYNDAENYSKALEMLRTLNKIQPNNFDTIEDIVSIYLRQNQFEKAMFWGNKAIYNDPKNGKGYEIRGKIYQATADYCSVQHEGDKSFDDKLVYQMAYEDLTKSRKLGNARIISTLDYVKNFIPNEEDLFMVETKSEYKAEGECYRWISRIVKRSTLQ